MCAACAMSTKKPVFDKTGLTVIEHENEIGRAGRPNIFYVAIAINMAIASPAYFYASSYQDGLLGTTITAGVAIIRFGITTSFYGIDFEDVEQIYFLPGTMHAGEMTKNTRIILKTRNDPALKLHITVRKRYH